MNHKFGHDPIAVICADKLADITPIKPAPIIVAYNGVHYKHLIPAKEGDVLKLVEKYMSGTRGCKEEASIASTHSQISPPQSVYGDQHHNKDEHGSSWTTTPSKKRRTSHLDCPPGVPKKDNKSEGAFSYLEQRSIHRYHHILDQEMLVMIHMFAYS